MELPKFILKLSEGVIKPFRDKLLAPLGMKFDAPNKVELYLFGDNCFMVENINDETVDVSLDLPKVSKVVSTLTLPEDNGKAVKIKLSPRSLVAIEYN